MYNDKIISIIKNIGTTPTVDITTDGNQLFYANGILTHNSGSTSSDLGLEDTSESFGLPASSDIFFALISTEELADMNQMMVKQLKNRYGDINKYRRFVIGVDRAKMKLFNTEQSAQKDIMDGPAFDTTPSGQRVKFDKTLFEDFN